MSKSYGKYLINFNLNKEHEITYIPKEYYNLHLELNKATIHTYHYLCLKANRAAISFFLQIYYLAYTKYFNTAISLYRPEKYCFELNLDISKEYASDKGVYSHV